ncbi:MAG: hypothetical protein RLZZ42_1456 [Bacteroidota bacterium]
MIELVFPQPDFRIRSWQERRQIFDVIRKKWVDLQPEEWVRQNVIQWLIHIHQIPVSAIAVEKKIKINGNEYRFDLLVYDKVHSPWMLIECKAPEIAITEKALLQVLNYQQVIPAKFFMLVNGLECHLAEKEPGNPVWISRFPAYHY